MKCYFVTGTDTGVGKTHISEGLLHVLNQEGLLTIGLKPIASGCLHTPEGYRNTDAVTLQSAASVYLPYEYVNPFAFKDPIAPHIEAELIGKCLTSERLLRVCKPALSANAEIGIIEGIGGWFVPLNDHETMADFVKALNVPVILIVGMRLGCLNHTLLTCEAIQAMGIKLAGWVANCINPEMLMLEANILALESRIEAPLLAKVDYGVRPEEIQFQFEEEFSML